MGGATAFGLYSKYYDLLYANKPYFEEASFVSQALRSQKSDSLSLLELGCGTGKHAIEFSRMGWMVAGVDLSKPMIEEAHIRLSKQGLNLERIPELSVGDVRTLNLGRRFDAVVSLFHVASYQVKTPDFLSFLKTARRHLERGGLFLFDVWHGPAVLSIGPSIRVVRLKDDEAEVIRIAEPALETESSAVTVNYNLFVRRSSEEIFHRIHETHRMRYFFKLELERFFEEAGFGLVRSAEWMTNESPSSSTWSVFYLCRAL